MNIENVYFHEHRGERTDFQCVPPVETLQCVSCEQGQVLQLQALADGSATDHQLLVKF